MEDFKFEGQATDTGSKFIDANSVAICEVTEFTYNEQYNLMNVVFTNEAGQTGKGGFGLSEKALPYVLTLMASGASKAGRVAEMQAAFPQGKVPEDMQTFVDKLSGVLTGAKLAVLFGGKQSKGVWYSNVPLFGAFAEPTEEGVKALETKRLTLQKDAKFMKAEEVVDVTPQADIKF